MNESSLAAPPSPAVAPWLVGGGDMGERLRTRDWSRTSLGPLDTWPASLCTAVNLCLGLPSASMIVWGPDRLMLYNDAFRGLCGERRDQLLGEPIDAYWGLAWPALRDAYARALGGQPATFGPQPVFIDQGRGPEEAHLQGSLTPLRDEQGAVRGVWNAWVETPQRGLDVTPGMAPAHRHHVYELLDHAPSIAAILQGPEHVFEFVNRNFQALAPGRSFLGQRVRDAFPDLEGQRLLEILDEVYRTGVSFCGQQMELRSDLCQAGRARDSIIHYTCQPLRDPAGTITGVLSAHVDITEWVESRRREEQRAAELEAIIDSIPDGVCIADASGHVRTNRMDPEFLRSSGIEEALQDALRGETSTRDMYLPQQDTGRYRVIRSATAPVRLREAIVGAVSINMDITERKRTEEEREVLLANEQAARGDAERANRKKDEFLARVSHELATPLVGMRLWLDLLRSEPSRLAEASAALTQCIQTQSRIVHDLLDTARALSGKMSVALEACEPSEPIEAAVKDLRPLAQQKGVALEVTLGETSLILADPKRMQQVMSNLLSNAVKFTPPGGHVDVRLTAEQGGVCITVQDTGRGFPPEFQPMLFAPFRQEEESTTRANGGLGLGLSIVRQLVELQGGTVWAESPGRGLGATFTVWLPAQEDAPEDAHDEDERAEDLQLKGLRLLLVEDDDITRTAMAALLRRHGAHVEAEENAARGLATLRRGGFDALVCDIAMPGEDGLSLIRKVRALEGPCGQIPAAAFSAHMREEDRLQALMAGFQMHIPKSVETHQLIQQLQALVNTPPVEE